MKTKFRVFGLKENEIVKSAWLSSDGIRTETEYIVTRHHLNTFDSKFKAIDFIINHEDKFEHGFEIIETFEK